MDTSADCVGPATSVLTLLLGFGSVVGLLTVAVFVRVATVTPEAMATVIDRVRVAPFTNPAGSVHTSLPASRVHDHPAEMLTKLSPAGSGSVSVSGPAASLGPLSVMVKL